MGFLEKESKTQLYSQLSQRSLISRKYVIYKNIYVGSRQKMTDMDINPAAYKSIETARWSVGLAEFLVVFSNNIT